MTVPRYTLRHRIADLCDDNLLGTVASPASGTFVDTSLEFPDDYFNNTGAEVSCYNGNSGSIGESGVASDFVNSSHTVTFKPAQTWVAADSVEFHWKFTYAQYNRMINQVLDAICRYALKDKVDETLVLGNILSNPNFEAWASASSCTGWTAGGTGVTLARESSIVYNSLYSAKLTNQVSQVATLSQSIANYPLYSGKVADFYAHVMCLTASRVRLSLTDGVTTWYSDYHDGKGWRVSETYPYLYIKDKTLSTAPSELTAALRIETGSSIDAYIDKAWLVVGDDIYEYAMSSGFLYLSEVYRETSQRNVFEDNPIDQRLYDIVQGSSPAIRFSSAYSGLVSGYKLRLIGQERRQAALTADSDTIDEDIADYIVYESAARLLSSKNPKDSAAKEYRLLAEKKLREIHTYLHVGARRVRDN